MDAVAMPFGLMGFVFGLIAFTQVSAAMKRIEKLEQRLERAGLCGGDDLSEGPVSSEP